MTSCYLIILMTLLSPENVGDKEKHALQMLDVQVENHVKFQMDSGMRVYRYGGGDSPRPSLKIP